MADTVRKGWSLTDEAWACPRQLCPGSQASSHQPLSLQQLNSPSTDLYLDQGEVHVWRANLDIPVANTDALWRTLSTDEKERTERFHFARDRHHFIAARGILRAILGLYLGMDPDQVRFEHNPNGKPSIVPEQNNDCLCFNISHSDSLALYALTRSRHVGIDVESLRKSNHYDEIAVSFFAPTEVAIIRQLPAASRPRAFLTGWTRKEAYLKARGQGLSHPLNTFEVTLAPGQPPALLRTPEGPLETSRWTIIDLAPAPDYAAALVVEGSISTIRLWSWPDTPAANR